MFVVLQAPMAPRTRSQFPTSRGTTSAQFSSACNPHRDRLHLLPMLADDPDSAGLGELRWAACNADSLERVHVAAWGEGAGGFDLADH